MYKLTFDTSARVNTFQDPARQVTPEMVRAVEAAKKLREAHDKGLIEITYNTGEPPKTPTEAGTLKEATGPWVLGLVGFSELGKSTVLLSDDKANLLTSVRSILSPGGDQSMKDFAILAEHIVAGRDIFVSEDKKRHLKKAKDLAKLGAIVKSAPETIEFLEKQGAI